MSEEQRKVGRQRKDAEVNSKECRPSAATLAALVLPQIMVTYGVGNVESNCELAMKYSMRLLTLEGE